MPFYKLILISVQLIQLEKDKLVEQKLKLNFSKNEYKCVKYQIMIENSGNTNKEIELDL